MNYLPICMLSPHYVSFIFLCTDHSFLSPAGLVYATVGVHPCSVKTFETQPSGPTALLHSLETLALSAKAAGTCTAFGEIGLDYDRLYHASKETQLRYFAAQLDIAVRVQLPLFLHSRAAAEDFERLLGERLGELPKRGLVHSFTGTVEEMRRLVEMGFHVGVNGCSMKTEENLEVVRAIPLARLQIETDGPWVSPIFFAMDRLFFIFDPVSSLPGSVTAQSCLPNPFISHLKSQNSILLHASPPIILQ